MMTSADIKQQDDNAIAHMLALYPVGDPRRAIWESLAADEDED